MDKTLGQETKADAAAEDVSNGMGLLRFITCGSVDDGKSTLLGRLLYDAATLKEDQLAALAADSSRIGTQGKNLDFALLVDGLAAEREQGITIDVAYRFFATANRAFIAADTPGHEQYTRNMVTGASTADAAVVLVDASKGMLTQTCRHTFLASLVGIRHIALAVNKMDLVSYSQSSFNRIADQYAAFAAALGFASVTAIPLCALHGENVNCLSAKMRWYQGPTLLEWLEAVPVHHARMRMLPLRFPVQWVNRPSSDFRGFAGTIASGCMRPGDKIRIQPSGKDTTIKRIATQDGDLLAAYSGSAVTITLNDEVDLSRGDLVSSFDAPATVADQFEAKVVWMSEEPLYPARAYWLKIGRRTVNARVTRIKHRVDVNTMAKMPGAMLELNAIGVCNFSTDQPLCFDAYDENPATGCFILIDRLTNGTVGAGMINFALGRSQHVHPHAFTIDKAARAALNTQKPCLLWFTGLSGSGKSTIANLLEQRLHGEGCRTYILDGDNLRSGLNRDLGFSEADRVENVRRVAEVGRMMVDAGMIVMTTLISPFKADRDAARARFMPDEFFEVFIDTPLHVCEARDPKGLYGKAREGKIRNFTGIDSPYSPPATPDIRIDAANMSAQEAADQLYRFLAARRADH